MSTGRLEVPGLWGQAMAAHHHPADRRSVSSGQAAHGLHERRGVIEACLEEPLTPGSKLIMRDCPYVRVNAQHIKMLRDRKKNTPGAANNRKKYLSAMFVL
jgi:hypothetical protein